MSKRSKLTSIIVTAAAILIATILAISAMAALTVRANQEVLRRRAVIDRVRQALSSMKDAESGQRGYLLTGDERYLESYNRALTEVRAELDALTSAGLAGRISAADLSALSGLADQRITVLNETIAVRRTQGLPAALAIVRSSLGEHGMDAMRNVVARIAAAQDRALDGAHERADALVYESRLVVGLAGLLNLAVLFWAYWRITEETRAREDAAREVRRQRDLLEITLASIGDAVIITDREARITFLNPVAEKLTGWNFPEAFNQPCANVFRIVNQDSGAPVESPVQKVLRLGTIAGLANHMLLIRKDGSEIPIDDSGAPIREADGSMLGVILIFRDISDQRAAHRRLFEANQALELASQAKDQFLAALSHELRTPLTPVLATLTTWEVSDDLPSSFLADIQMLRRNVELEARLIDDLLDVTRIANAKLSLNLELVDAHELLQNVVAMYQSEIRAKRLSVSMNLAAERHYVKADSARLQQVFGNILNNAVKFTASGGHIDISTSNDSEQRLKMIFADDGIGMSADTLEGIFAPFNQGKDGITERYGGLGLGMAISKALVDVHAGALSAASQGLGQGSVFTLSIPSIHAETSRIEAIAGTGAAQGFQTDGMSILLVEDHEDSAEVLARLLRLRGYRVEACATVADAIRLARSERFDLLISDIGLPDGTGVDLIQEIRRDSSIPAIALTGFGMDKDVARYRAAGFNGHLTKPVNFQRLEITIGQFLMRAPANK